MSNPLHMTPREKEFDRRITELEGIVAKLSVIKHPFPPFPPFQPAPWPAPGVTTITTGTSWIPNVDGEVHKRLMAEKDARIAELEAELAEKGYELYAQDTRIDELNDKLVTIRQLLGE